MAKPLVVITGATSGIGLETAKCFAEKGYPLLLIGRDLKKLASFSYDNALIAQVDVTDLSALKAAIEKAETQFGPADLIINNAGVMLLNPIDTQSPSEWETMLQVNVLGVMNGVNAVLSGMKSRQHGTIMNVSSIAGIKPFPNHAAYTATKFAVHGFTDNVREEVAPFNVRVMTIAPGAVETPLLSHTNNDEIKAAYGEWKQEIGGVLRPEDVARTMLFAYEQPQSVNLREIVLSSTGQVA